MMKNVMRKQIYMEVGYMLDREHDEFNWPLVFNWTKIVGVSCLWWWSLFSKGILITLLWSIVVIAVIVLCTILKDNRA